MPASATTAGAAPQLYLVIPPQLIGRLATLDVGEVLRATPPAAALLQIPEPADRDFLAALKPLVAAVQAAGAAVLIEGDHRLVGRLSADGVHISAPEALDEALQSLKPAYIVGAGGLNTRHAAMLAAEAGADYVMFGEPDAAGQRAAFDTVLERVAWWSEVFEPPCVALAQSRDEVRPLAQAGADFVAIGEFVWTDTGGTTEAMAAVAAELRSSELV
jgi:thiamine-phosphate pyrophosphorylase